jgi:dTDP-4-dehydrorhamnose 3,5-epimerase-like enzyme
MAELPGGAYLFQVQEIHDERGRLGVLEVGDSVPFTVRRVFFTYDLRQNATRGGHAHKALEEVLVCMGGALTVSLDNGWDKVSVRLSRPGVGLYIPRLVWKELYDFTPDTVYLVMASTAYDPQDYIRDYNTFIRLVAASEACEVSDVRAPL